MIHNWHRLEKYLFFVRHCQNLRIFSCVSKRNVKLILKILSDLAPRFTRVLNRPTRAKKTPIYTRQINYKFHSDIFCFFYTYNLMN
jgi:hypothetical protein